MNLARYGLIALLAFPAIAVAQTALPTPLDLSAYADPIAAWEPDIARLEALDRAAPDPENAVLLIGSSSIRRWETAADDLAPYPVIRRGYGGAKFSDLAYYAPRLVTPHRYRAAVVFVANDVRDRPDDKEPNEVGRLFAYVAEVLTRHQPEAQVICCDVRPAPSRFRVWDKIQASNRALRAECDQRPRVHYLDTASEFLTADGSAARADLYGPDRLHLSPAGTAVWSRLIKAELDRVLVD